MRRQAGLPSPRSAPHPVASAPLPPRRALVTGGSGFIGRHLARHLVAAGWQVTIVVRSTSRLPADLAADCQTLVADSPSEEFSWAVEQARPDVCFHLATHFSNSRDAADISELVDSNITFGAKLLEALTRVPQATVVNAGSRMQHFEAEQYRPVSLYAATKQAFSDVLAYYADVHSLRAVTVEFPDTYGHDDPRQKLLSLLQSAASTGTPLAMSPGEQLIEILHVADAVQALVASVDLADRRAAVYSATGTSMPLRRFVQLVQEVTGRHIPVQWGARPYRDREMMSPWTHWPTLPGWSPDVELASGLRDVLTTGYDRVNTAQNRVFESSAATNRR